MHKEQNRATFNERRGLRADLRSGSYSREELEGFVRTILSKAVVQTSEAERSSLRICKIITQSESFSEGLKKASECSGINKFSLYSLIKLSNNPGPEWEMKKMLFQQSNPGLKTGNFTCFIIKSIEAKDLVASREAFKEGSICFQLLPQSRGPKWGYLFCERGF